jgi:hypothetical protein
LLEIAPIALAEPRDSELEEASGLRRGQSVTVLTPTVGDDQDSVEHSMPAGSEGRVVSIDRLPGPQGVSFTVFVPVDGAGNRGFFNVFDEADGPISKFLTAVDPEPAPRQVTP